MYPLSLIWRQRGTVCLQNWKPSFHALLVPLWGCGHLFCGSCLEDLLVQESHLVWNGQGHHACEMHQWPLCFQIKWTWRGLKGHLHTTQCASSSCLCTYIVVTQRDDGPDCCYHPVQSKSSLGHVHYHLYERVKAISCRLIDLRFQCTIFVVLWLK